MKAIISFSPLLPLLIPLIGMPVAWMLPTSPRVGRIRRWWYALALSVACVVLLLAALYRDSVVQVSFWYSSPTPGEHLVFSLDNVSQSFALLLVGALAAVSVASMARPLERSEGVLLLAIAGAGVGVCAAGNLLTLCLAWVLMDLALLGLGVVRVPEESIPHALRHVIVNLVSVALLIAATVLAMSAQTDARWWSDLGGLPLQLLMIAALLRLGIYPLPGSVNQRWEGFIASIGAGGYVWLRIAGTYGAALPGAQWLTSALWAVLLATALLAGLSSDFAIALPYIVLNHMAILVLAPLLSASSAPGVILATALNLVLCLVLLRVDLRVRPLPAFKRWTRLPLILALASLGGLPLTLGFYSRWSLLAAAMRGGWRGYVLPVAVAFALASVPLWQRFRQLQREIREGNFPLWTIRLAAAVAFLLAFLLIFFGLDLGVFGTDLLHLWKGSSASAPPGLWPGSIKLFGVLLLIVLVIPLSGSYALYKLRRRIPERVSAWFDTPSAILELNWVYVGIEVVLERARYLLEQLSLAVEESFYLGWVLLWGLVLLFYFSGR